MLVGLMRLLICSRAAVAAAASVILFGSHNAAGQGAATPESSALLSFLFEEMSHILVGVLAAIGGVAAQRSWSRRRWRPAPAATVTEAVLVVDLVESTQLATRHGEGLAMRARNVLERQAIASAQAHGVSFVETTGDGCLMTFPSVAAAARSAIGLVQGFKAGPAEMTQGPSLEVRAAITYGEILLDSRGKRHGAAINKAFRLVGVVQSTFVVVQREAHSEAIPDRNRILIDEEAASQPAPDQVKPRQIGVCSLKGFSGFHRVYELPIEAASARR